MSTVRVAVRVRPLSGREKDKKAHSIVTASGDNISINNVKLEGVPEFGDSRERVKHFTFDYCYDSMGHPQQQGYASQEVVYQDLGTEVLQAALEGYNTCLFAYGQTGTGKTYTMMGNMSEEGVIPRIGEGLFSHIQVQGENNEQRSSHRVDVSYLEIYNERVRDLLMTPGVGQVERHTLKVREHPKEGPYVEDLSLHSVMDDEAFQSLLLRGNENRTTAATHMHEHSSRSHAILTIVYTQDKLEEGLPHEIISKIHLVDLAGSERANPSYSSEHKIQLKEGSNINKSLVTLGNVIKTLAEKSLLSLSLDNMGSSQSFHSMSGGESMSSLLSSPRRARSLYIPYRDSILTWLLKDSLGGNSKTIMIATISPASIYYNETISTLRYAQRAKSIVNKPKVNEDPNVATIRELRNEITMLKEMIEASQLQSRRGSDSFYLVPTEGQEVSPSSDEQVDSTLSDKLKQDQSLVNKLTEEVQNKWKTAHAIMQDTDINISSLGRRASSSGVEIDSQVPYFIGLDYDIRRTGIKIYNIKEGTTHIGSKCSLTDHETIVLNGPDIKAEHCVLKNWKGTVTITPRHGAYLTVNGIETVSAKVLAQGDIVFLGRTQMFRYINPIQAASMSEGNMDSIPDHQSAMQHLWYRPSVEVERTCRTEQEQVALAQKELEKLTTALERQKAANEESEEQFLTARYEKMAEMKREKEELEEQMRQKQKDWDQEKARVQDELEHIHQQKRNLEEKLQDELKSVLERTDKQAAESSAASDSSEDLPVKGEDGKEIKYHRKSVEGQVKFLVEKELLTEIDQRQKMKDLETQTKELKDRYDKLLSELNHKQLEVEQQEEHVIKDVDHYKDIVNKDIEVRKLETEKEQLQFFIQEKKDLMHVKSATPKTLKVGISLEKLPISNQSASAEPSPRSTSLLSLSEKPKSMAQHLSLKVSDSSSDTPTGSQESLNSETSASDVVARSHTKKNLAQNVRSIVDRLYKPQPHKKFDYLKKKDRSPLSSPSQSTERLDHSSPETVPKRQFFKKGQGSHLSRSPTSSHRRTKGSKPEPHDKHQFLKKGNGHRASSSSPQPHKQSYADSEPHNKHQFLKKSDGNRASSSSPQPRKQAYAVSEPHNKHQFLKKSDGLRASSSSPQLRKQAYADSEPHNKHQFLKKSDGHRASSSSPQPRKQAYADSEPHNKHQFLKKSDGHRARSSPPHPHKQAYADSEPLKLKHAKRPKQSEETPKHEQIQTSSSFLHPDDATLQTSIRPSMDPLPLRNRPLSRCVSRASSLPKVPEAVGEETESADSQMRSAPNVTFDTSKVVLRKKKSRRWERPTSLPVGIEIAKMLAELGDGNIYDAGSTADCESGQALSEDGNLTDQMRSSSPLPDHASDEHSDSTGTDVTVLDRVGPMISSLDSCPEDMENMSTMAGDTSPNNAEADSVGMEESCDNTVTAGHSKDMDDVQEPCIQRQCVNDSDKSDGNQEESFSDSLDGDDHYSKDDCSAPESDAVTRPQSVMLGDVPETPGTVGDDSGAPLDTGRGVDAEDTLKVVQEEEYSQLSEESIPDADRLEKLQKALEHLERGSVGVGNGKRTKRPSQRPKVADSDSQDQLSDDSLRGSANHSRPSSRPGSGTRRRKRPVSKHKGRHHSSDEYQSSDTDGVFSDDSLTQSDGKQLPQPEDNAATLEEFSNFTNSMDQLTAGLGSGDSDGSHQHDVPALDLGTVIQRFSQSSQDGVLFQGLGDNLELEAGNSGKDGAGNSGKDSADVVLGDSGMSTDFTQTEGASVQMRRSPVNMWSSEEGDSLSPVSSSFPQEQRYTRGTRVASKRSNLTVTPTAVWTNCESGLTHECKNTENTGEQSFVSRTGLKSGSENSVNRDKSDSATKGRNDNSRSTIKYEVTINEDKTDISYNVEKTEYRTYGLKPKAVSGGQLENATAIIPDSININLTETKTFQTEDRYESVTKEKVLLQKGDGSGNRDTGVIVSEKLYESNHSLECEDVQRDSSVSRGSSVERQIVEEDFNSAAYVYEEDTMLGQTEHGAEGNVCSEYAIDSVNSPTSISEDKVLTNNLDSEGPGTYVSAVSNSETITGSGENCEIARDYSDGPCDISDDSLDAVSDSYGDQKTTLLPGQQLNERPVSDAHGISEGPLRTSWLGTDSHRELPQWQTETVQVGETESLNQNADDVDPNLQDRSLSPWVVIGRASTEYIDDNNRVNAAPYSREPIADLHLVEQNVVSPSSESTVHVHENRTLFPETIKQSFIDSNTGNTGKEALYFADGHGVLAGMNDMTLSHVSDDTFGRDGPIKSSNETEVQHHMASVQSLPSIGRGSATFLQDIPEASSDDEQPKTKHVHEYDRQNKTKNIDSSVTGDLSQEDSEKDPMTTSDLDNKDNMGHSSQGRDDVNSQPQKVFSGDDSKSTEQNLSFSSDQSPDSTSLRFEKGTEEDRGILNRTTALNRSTRVSESVPEEQAGCHSSDVTQDTKVDGSQILSNDQPFKDGLQSSVSLMPQASCDVKVIQGQQLGSADNLAPESNVCILQPSVNECSEKISGETVSVGERQARNQIYSEPTSPCQNTNGDNQVSGILPGTDPIIAVTEDDNPICGQFSAATKEIDIVVSDHILQDSLPDSSFSDLGDGQLFNEVSRESPEELPITAHYGEDQISSQQQQGHVLPDRAGTNMSDDYREDTQTMNLCISDDQKSRQQTVEKGADADREGIHRYTEKLIPDDDKVTVHVDPKELGNYRDNSQMVDSQTDAVHVSDEDRKASLDTDQKEAQYREDTHTAVSPSSYHRSGQHNVEKKEDETHRETSSVPEKPDVDQKQSGDYMEDIQTVDLCISEDQRADQKISDTDQETLTVHKCDDDKQVQQTDSLQNVDGKIADALHATRETSSVPEIDNDYREHTETVDIFVSDHQKSQQQNVDGKIADALYTAKETSSVPETHDIRQASTDVDQEQVDDYREHTDTVDIFVSDDQRIQQQMLDEKTTDASHKAKESSPVPETDDSRKVPMLADQMDADDYREHTETVDMFLSDDQRSRQQNVPEALHKAREASFVSETDDSRKVLTGADQMDADDYREHTETVDIFVSDDQKSRQQNVDGRIANDLLKPRETSSVAEANDSRKASAGVDQTESDDYREHTETIDLLISDDQRSQQLTVDQKTTDALHTAKATSSVPETHDSKKASTDVDQEAADDYREHTDTVDIFVSDDQRIQQQMLNGKTTDASHKAKESSPVPETDDSRKVPMLADQMDADDYREHTETVDIFVSDDQRSRQQRVDGKIANDLHKPGETSSVAEGHDSRKASTDVDQEEADDYREHSETIDMFISDDQRSQQLTVDEMTTDALHTAIEPSVPETVNRRKASTDVDSGEADDYRERTETVDIFVSGDQRNQQQNVDVKIPDALHTARETSTHADHEEADEYREHTETVDIFGSDDQRIQQQNVDGKIAGTLHKAREPSSVPETANSRKESTDVDSRETDDYREHTETVDIFVSGDQRILEQNVDGKIAGTLHKAQETSSVPETANSRRESTDVDSREADDYREHTEIVNIFVSGDQRIQEQNVDEKIAGTLHKAQETSSVPETSNSRRESTDVDSREADDYREHTETIDLFISDDQKSRQQIVDEKTTDALHSAREQSSVPETANSRRESTDVDSKEADDYREHTETVDIFGSDDQMIEQQNVDGKIVGLVHKTREPSSVPETTNSRRESTDVDSKEADDYREHTETVDIFGSGDQRIQEQNVDGKIAGTLHKAQETSSVPETANSKKESTDVDSKEADDYREHTETVDIFASDDQRIQGQNVDGKIAGTLHKAKEPSSVPETANSRKESTVDETEADDYREHTETVDIFVSGDQRIKEQNVDEKIAGTLHKAREPSSVPETANSRRESTDVDSKEADDYMEHTETVDIFVSGDQRIQGQNVDGKIAGTLHKAKEPSSVPETANSRKESTDVNSMEADDYREHTETVDIFVSGDQRIQGQNVDGKIAGTLHKAKEPSSVPETANSRKESTDVDSKEADDYREHTETIDLFISDDQKSRQQTVDEETTDVLHSAREPSSDRETVNRRKESTDVDSGEADDYREHTETVDIFVSGDQRIQEQNVDGKIAGTLHKAQETSSVPETANSRKESTDVDSREADDYMEHTETVDIFVSGDQRIQEQNVDGKIAGTLHKAQETSSVPETANSKKESTDVDSREADDYREHTETVDIFVSGDQRIQEQNVDGKIAGTLHKAQETSSVPETANSGRESTDVDSREADDDREHTEIVDIFVSGDQRIQGQNVDGKIAGTLHKAQETSSVPETANSRKESTDVDSKEADDYREHTETIDLFISDDQKSRQQTVDVETTDALHSAREPSSVRETVNRRKESTDVDSREADDYREHTEIVDIFVSGDQTIQEQNFDEKIAGTLHKAKEPSSVPETANSRRESTDVDSREADDYREHTETVDIFVSGDQRIQGQNVDGKIAGTLHKAKEPSSVPETANSRKESTDVDSKEADDYREHTETIDLFISDDQKSRQQTVDEETTDALHSAREPSSVRETVNRRKESTDVDSGEADDYREHTETVDIFVSGDQRIQEQNVDGKIAGTLHKAQETSSVPETANSGRESTDVDSREADDYREHTEIVDIFVSGDQRIQGQNVDGKIAGTLHKAQETSSVPETANSGRESTVDETEADDYREHTETVDIFVSGDQRIQEQNVNGKIAGTLHKAQETSSVPETANSRKESTDVDLREADDYREHTEIVDIFVSGDQTVQEQNVDEKIAGTLHKAQETSSVPETANSRKESTVDETEADDYMEHTETVDIFVSGDQRILEQNVNGKIAGTLHKAQETSSVPETANSGRESTDVDSREADDYREHTEIVDVFVSGDQRIQEQNVDEKIDGTLHKAQETSSVPETANSRKESTVDETEADDYRQHTETIDLFMSDDQKSRQQTVDEKTTDALHSAREPSSVPETFNRRKASTDKDSGEADDYREHTETVDIFVSGDQIIQEQNVDGKIAGALHKAKEPSSDPETANSRKESTVDETEADDYRQHTETIDLFMSDDQSSRQQNVDGKTTDAVHIAREATIVPETGNSRKISTDSDQEEADDYREHTKTVDIFVSDDLRSHQQNADLKIADAFHAAKEASTDGDQEEADDYREHTETVDIFVSDDQRIRQQNVDGKIDDGCHKTRETSSVPETDNSTTVSADGDQEETDDYREHTETVDIFVSGDLRSRRQNVDEKITVQTAREASFVPGCDDSTRAPSYVDQEEDDDYMEDTETIDLFLSNYRKSWQQTAKKNPNSHQKDTVTVSVHEAENDDQTEADNYKEDTEVVDLFISNDHRIQQQKVEVKEDKALHEDTKTVGMFDTKRHKGETHSTDHMYVKCEKTDSLLPKESSQENTKALVKSNEISGKSIENPFTNADLEQPAKFSESANVSTTWIHGQTAGHSSSLRLTMDNTDSPNHLEEKTVSCCLTDSGNTHGLHQGAPGDLPYSQHHTLHDTKHVDVNQYDATSNTQSLNQGTSVVKTEKPREDRLSESSSKMTSSQLSKRPFSQEPSTTFLKPVISGSEPNLSVHNAKAKEDRDILELVSNIDNIETETERKALRKEVKEEIKKLKYRDQSDSAISSDYTDLESSSPRSSQSKEQDTPKRVYQEEVQIRQTFHQTMTRGDFLTLVAKDEVHERSSLKDSGNVYDADEVDPPQEEDYLFDVKQTKNKPDVTGLQAVESVVTIQTHTEDMQDDSRSLSDVNVLERQSSSIRNVHDRESSVTNQGGYAMSTERSPLMSNITSVAEQEIPNQSLPCESVSSPPQLDQLGSAGVLKATDDAVQVPVERSVASEHLPKYLVSETVHRSLPESMEAVHEYKQPEEDNGMVIPDDRDGSFGTYGGDIEGFTNQHSSAEDSDNSYTLSSHRQPASMGSSISDRMTISHRHEADWQTEESPVQKHDTKNGDSSEVIGHSSYSAAGYDSQGLPRAPSADTIDIYTPFVGQHEDSVDRTMQASENAVLELNIPSVAENPSRHISDVHLRNESITDLHKNAKQHIGHSSPQCQPFQELGNHPNNWQSVSTQVDPSPQTSQSSHHISQWSQTCISNECSTQTEYMGNRTAGIQTDEDIVPPDVSMKSQTSQTIETVYGNQAPPTSRYMASRTMRRQPPHQLPPDVGDQHRDFSSDEEYILTRRDSGFSSLANSPSVISVESSRSYLSSVSTQTESRAIQRSSSASQTLNRNDPHFDNESSVRQGQISSTLYISNEEQTQTLFPGQSQNSDASSIDQIRRQYQNERLCDASAQTDSSSGGRMTNSETQTVSVYPLMQRSTESADQYHAQPHHVEYQQQHLEEGILGPGNYGSVEGLSLRRQQYSMLESHSQTGARPYSVHTQNESTSVTQQGQVMSDNRLGTLEGGLPILSEAHTHHTSSAQTDSEFFSPRKEEGQDEVQQSAMQDASVSTDFADYDSFTRGSAMSSEAHTQLTRSAQTDSEFFSPREEEGQDEVQQSAMQDASVSTDFTDYDRFTRGSAMSSEAGTQVARSAQTYSEFFASSDDDGEGKIKQSALKDASVSADFEYYDNFERGSTMFSEAERYVTGSAQTDSEFFVSSDDDSDVKVQQSALKDASVSTDLPNYDSFTRGSTVSSEAQLTRSAQTDSEFFVSSDGHGEGKIQQSALKDVSVSVDFENYDSFTRGSTMYSEVDSQLTRSAQTDSEFFVSSDDDGEGKIQQSALKDVSVSVDFTDDDGEGKIQQSALKDVSVSVDFTDDDGEGKIQQSALKDVSVSVDFTDDDGEGKIQQSALKDVSVFVDFTDYVGVGVQTDEEQESSMEIIPHLKQFPHEGIRNQQHEDQSVETQQHREHAMQRISSISVAAQTKDEDSEKEKSSETRTSVQTESDMYGTDTFEISENRISLKTESDLHKDIANVSSSGPVYHHEVESSESIMVKLSEASNSDPSLQTNSGSFTDQESPQNHMSDRSSIRNIQSDELSLPPVLTSVSKDIDKLRREHSRMMELLERSRGKSTTLSPKSKGSPPSSSSSSMSPVTVIEKGGSNNGSLEGSPPETQRDRPACTDEKDTQLNREEILKSLEVEDLTLRIGTASEQAFKSTNFENDNETESFLTSSHSSDQNLGTATMMNRNKSSEKDNENKETNVTESQTMSASMCETTQTTEPVSVNDGSQTPHPCASATQTTSDFDYQNNLIPPQIHIDITDEDVVDDILSDNSTTPCMSPSTVPEIIDDDSCLSSDNPSHTMTISSRRYVSTGVEACVDSSDEFTQTDYEDSTLDSSFSSDKYRQTSVKSTSTDSVRIQSELERLERERIEIIELLSLNYLPSSLTVELLEAKMNYCIGQTDMLLASLEDSWDKEYTELTSSNAGLSRVTKEYVSNYKQQFKESRREMAAAIETKQRLNSRGRGRRKARNSDMLKMKRRAEIESFKLERLREQEMYQRTRSYSPLKQHVPEATVRGRSSPSAEQSPQEFTPKYMTPKQRKRHLVSIRRKIVAESEDELHHLRSRSVSPISDYYLTESRYSLNSSRESSFSPDRTLSPQMYNHHGYSTHGTNELRDIYLESMYRPHSTGSIYSRYSVDRPPSRSVSAAQIMSNGVDPDQMIQESAIIRQLNQRQILEAQSSLRQLEARQRLTSMPMTSSPRSSSASFSASNAPRRASSNNINITQEAIDDEIQSMRQEHSRSSGSPDLMETSSRYDSHYTTSLQSSFSSYAAYARDHLARSERRIQTIIHQVPGYPPSPRSSPWDNQGSRRQSLSPAPSIVSDLHASTESLAESSSTTYMSFASNISSNDENRYSRSRPISSMDVKAKISRRVRR